MNYRLAIGLVLAIAVSSSPAIAKRSKSPKVPSPPQAVSQEPAKMREKVVTDGLYEDATHARHRWKITQGHALMWDDSPYLPVGGAFTPHIWVEGMTDANWNADLRALGTLKTHQIMDLYLSAGPTGLTHVPVAAVQKVLDWLDTNGFRYGIEIADFSKDPLAGYVVKPALYRDPAPSIGSPSRFAHIPGLVDALYVLVSAHDGDIVESGNARIEDDTAVARTTNDGDGNILLLYPQRLYKTGTPESHMPDLWQGGDEYRDRLLAFFRQIHLGKGLRFFLDPVADRIGLEGDAANVIPTTDGFRLDFEAWLYKKYARNVDDLNDRWGVIDRDLPDFKTAARCIPLWFETKGVLALYDPVKKALHPIAKKTSSDRFWTDFRTFRSESMHGYLNAITGILKKSVANVPVIYRWAPNSPLSVVSGDEGSFDGFGIEAYGHGQGLTSQAAANAYAQTEESPNTLWLIVSDTQEAATPADKSAPGYTSKETLFEDWNSLKNAGARGFFTMALQRLPEADFAPVNMVEQPDQLDWLSAYWASLDSASWKLSEENTPVPWLSPGAALTGDGQHLPTGDGANNTTGILTLGPNLDGYRLPQDVGTFHSYMVWSPGGVVKSTKFAFGKGVTPTVKDAAGNLVKTTQRHGEWTIPVGAAPIIIGHIMDLPLPTDAADNMALEASRLIRLAESQKIILQGIKERLYYAQNLVVDNPQELIVRFHLISKVVDQMTEILRPYAWIEGEGAESYTFDSLVAEPGTSNGGYLSLDTDRDPPSDPEKMGYQASYKFTVNAAGRYTLWFAGSSMESATASPMQFRVDKGVLRDARTDTPPSPVYAGKFVWSNLGEVTLDRGAHTVTFSVSERRASDNKYVAAIDAICFSRVPFQPDGTRRPEIQPEVVDARETGKKR